ncbi:hypothetical protein [Lactiplantibacillus paraplantarum]|uniref:hypothetical protein n=1 Tax=Lactiplantibacillus paraplantarum TaxID=60520 RepID=UPI000FEDC6EC|nr:hypothetical protein [Lactiplantibacillus paraplantarum]RKD28341.1 hypothetical protein BG617_10480 [Lactiplantibacillus paraplantarum]
MAESNATQVILTDDGIKIIKAQNTADNAAGGVTNLNDPNLMSVIEKQTAVSQYAGLTSQYNVVLARAKDAYVSTSALTTAYTNLNTFMTAMLTDTAKASDVNRDTYKGLIDAYNVALLNVQNDLKAAYNTDIDNMQSSVSVASQAASSAAIVASQAAITGDNASHEATQAAIAASQAQIAGNNANSVANNATSIANSATSTADNATSIASRATSSALLVGSQASSEIAVQSTATAKAQSTADNAFSRAATAIDNGKVTSQSVTDLKDGSTMTIAGLENGLATKVANSEYASYKTQTASQIAQKVDNGAFSAYKSTTADLIASKVATKDFSTYQATTAKSIESKVESSDFNTYKTQTDKLISSKVSTVDFNNLGGGRNYLLNSKLITITPTGKANYDYRIYLSDDFWKNPDRLIANNIKVSFTMRVQNALSTDFNSDVYFGASPWYANSISYPAGTTKLRKYKLTYSITDSTYTATNLFIRFQDTNKADNPFIIENVTLSIGSNFVDWSPAPEDQATQSQIAQLSGDINLRVTKGDLIDQINIQAGNTLISSSGQLTLSGKSVFLDSVNPVIIKSANIADLAVGTAQIGDGAITNAKIGKLAVGTAQIANAAITDAQVGNVSANKLTAGTIDFNTITGKNINASNITTGTLSTNRLNVGKLSALSANLGDVTTGSLKGVDIVAKTFSTPNGSFTTDASGAITAKNMTLMGGTLTSPTINASTINGSTINGGTLNMQTDGLINSPYTGIVQTADNFYHPWKLNTGQLTIGQGYITSVSSGTRSINGVPKQFNSLQGTLSASYLKFTNDYGARTYIDADMFTYSNQTNDTAMVAISASGIGINMGAANAPALTISNGYIDASSSSSYGTFGAITLGYNAHTINSDGSLFFESGHGSGNPGINIWAKGFQSLSSRLSTKRQVRLLDDEHSNSLLLGSDTATFQYNQDTNADNSNEGVIIDDVNTAKQYSLPDELMTRDGKAPTDLMSFIARVISQNKYQARLIEDLQIRLRKVEINNG